MNALTCPSCGADGELNRYCGACGFDLSVQTRQLVAAARTAVDAAQLPIASMLAGRYRIDAVLAVGSMGTVYAATDLDQEGAPRAIKELLEFWGTAQERAEAETWFAREGRTLRDLDHPAIPRVYAAFSTGARHYLVMDLVEGRTLEAVLAEYGGAGLPEEQVIGWADQVLDVLSYLHSRPDPLIFRDLKPANLMHTPQGHVRLIDFGIARIFARQTKGTAIGTPGYAPPEQYQGFAEPASDIYALGATMHHLLTGRDPRTARPFDFPPVQSLAPWLSGHVAAAINRALVLDPRRRFDTAADMYRALHATVPLIDLPKLTVAVPQMPSPAGGALPAPADAIVQVLLTRADASALQDGGYLAPGSGQVTYAGITLIATLDRTLIELHNHMSERLPCAFASDVPSLVAQQDSAWLEPHGMCIVAYVAAPSSEGSVAGTSSPGVAATPSLVSAHQLVQVDDLAIRLRVLGAPLPDHSARLTLLPGLLPVSVLAVSSGSAVLIALVMHLTLLHFYLLEVPALALAVALQRRRRRRP